MSLNKFESKVASDNAESNVAPDPTHIASDKSESNEASDKTTTNITSDKTTTNMTSDQTASNIFLNHSGSNMKNLEMSMSLNNKTDVQILSELKTWVGKEREAVTHVLYYLREVEERKLYLLEACSLFEFCMKVLKYSRHEAQARVDAMRLLKVVPEIDADLDAGRLSLTVAAQTMSSFRKEDARRKSAGENLLSKEERKTVLADLMSASTREADLKLATHFPGQPQPERTKPVSETLTRIEFNASEAAKKKFERLQAHYFHQTGGSWEKLFELLADHEIKKLDTPPRRATGLTSIRKSAPSAHTRYIRKQTHQHIWSNWEKGCEHQLENGERCGSRRNLQRDHILEFSKGGANTATNLRLLCGAHNRYRSDQTQKFRRDCMANIERVRIEGFQHLFAEAIRSNGAVVFADGIG